MAPRDANRRPTRLMIALVAAVVLGAVGVAAVVIPRDAVMPDDAPAVPEDASADELADRACSFLTLELGEQIAADAPAAEVRSDIARAERQAEAAAAEDVRWVALASGVGALRVALEEDDPEAARVAVAVVTTECER